MLLRINNLSKGFSGIRMETLQTMAYMLNKGVTPIIPEKGSLGASGDLAPLSHMVLPMIGLGLAEYQGEVLPGKEAMDPGRNSSDRAFSQGRLGAEQRNAGHDKRRLFSAL